MQAGEALGGPGAGQGQGLPRFKRMSRLPCRDKSWRLGEEAGKLLQLVVPVRGDN